MASPTTNLLLTDLDNGDGENTWGDTQDANWAIVDAKIGNVTSIATTSGTVALTTSQERVNVLRCTGALVGNLTLEFSGRGGSWIVWNATSGAFSVTAKVSGQTGVVVTQGTKSIVFCDGTDIREGSALTTALVAISALTPAADRLPYYTSASAAALATFTAAGRALVDDADAAAQRTTLGLGTGNSPTFTGLTLTGAIGVTSGTITGLTDLKAYAGAAQTLQFGNTGGASQYIIQFINASTEVGNVKINASNDGITLGGVTGFPFATANALSNLLDALPTGNASGAAIGIPAGITVPLKAAGLGFPVWTAVTST